MKSIPARRKLKLLGLALFAIFGLAGAARAETNGCSAWEQSGAACMVGAGIEGQAWTRNCERDPQICHGTPHRPDQRVCKATTFCAQDSVDPNSMTDDCTEWTRGDSSYACNDPRESHWVRSCQWHNLPTNVCSSQQP